MAIDGDELLPKIPPKNKVLDVSIKSALDLGTELELMRKRADQMKSKDKGKSKEQKIKSEKIKDFKEEKQRVDDVYEKSRRGLEEKVKLYKKIKRGEIDDKGEVMINDNDYDNEEESSSDEDGDNLVEIIDSFGRSRLVPESKAYKYEREGDSSDEDRLKVARPTKLHYGDTIQYEAFNLDKSAVEDVYKRDRDSEEMHYNADWELRDRGVGFYKFSKDEEQRKKEMENLQKMNKAILVENEEITKLREKRKSDYTLRIDEIKALRKVNLGRSND